MKISEHFDMDEFTHSQAAARAGRDLVVPVELMPNLTQLCDKVLEPIRAELGRPVRISSGYRDAVVNSMVGGASNSAHMQARAADITAPGVKAYQLAKLIHAMSLPDIDKCILEFGQWVHVQIAAPGGIPRQQYLTAVRFNGRTTYLTGIQERHL